MTDYKRLKIAQLRDLLETRNLPVTGNKSVLIQRLSQADNEARGLEPSASQAEVATTTLTLGELQASRSRVFEWATAALNAETNVEPKHLELQSAVGHSDLPEVQNLLLRIGEIMRKMRVPESPSMSTTIEDLKSELAIATRHKVHSDITKTLWKIFDLEVIVKDSGESSSTMEEDYMRLFILPVKQALLEWLPTSLKRIQFAAPATKFPEHFNKADIANLRSWAKMHIRVEEIDPEDIKEDDYLNALNDESLQVDRAKSLPVVKSIINQACAAIRRDQRDVKKRREKRGTATANSRNDDNDHAEDDDAVEFTGAQEKVGERSVPPISKRLRPRANVQPREQDSNSTVEYYEEDIQEDTDADDATLAPPSKRTAIDDWNETWRL